MLVFVSTHQSFLKSPIINSFEWNKCRPKKSELIKTPLIVLRVGRLLLYYDLEIILFVRVIVLVSLVFVIVLLFIVLPVTSVLSMFGFLQN